MPFPFKKRDPDHLPEHDRLYKAVPPVAAPAGFYLRDDGTWQPVSGGGGGGGAVASVNGKTGVVVLTPSDVGAATAAQGAKADTALQSAPVASVNGKGGAVVLAASDVGAATSAQGVKADTAVQPAALSSYAPLASPALTGAPTAPTQATADNSTRVATTAYVKQAALSRALIAAKGDLVTGDGSGAPSRFLVGADGQVLTADSSKASGLAWTTPPSGGGGAVASVNGKTGVVVLAASDVGAATSAQGAKADTAVQPAGLAGYAPLASPALTGNPTVPNQTAGDSSTKAANTKFVSDAIAAAGGGGGGSSGPMNSVTGTGTGVAVGTAEATIGSVTINVKNAASKILVVATASLTKDTGTTVRTATVRVRAGTLNTDAQIGATKQLTSPATASAPYYGSAVILGEHTPGAVGDQTYTVRGLVAAGASTAAWDLEAVELVQGTSGGGGGACLPTYGQAVPHQPEAAGQVRMGDQAADGKAWTNVQANRLYVYPVWYDGTRPVDGFGVNLRGGSAGGVVYLGIFANLASGFGPGAVLAQTSLGADTAGWKQALLGSSTPLPAAGWYWHGLMCTAAIDIFSRNSSARVFVDAPTIENAVRGDSALSQCLSGMVTGPLTNNPTVTADAAGAPIVAVRFA